MKIGMRTILPLIIAVIALLYGVLDYSGGTDHLRGRDASLAIWERLSTVPSGDSVIIFAEDEHFSKGIPFIIANTRNEAVREARTKGVKATAIGRVGSIAHPPGSETFPPQGIVVRFYASPSSPIFVGYNYTRHDRDSGWAYWLGSLGEIPLWVEESRSQERFIVYTLLLGLLSVVVAIQETLPSRRSNSSLKEANTLGKPAILMFAVCMLIVVVLVLTAVIFWLPTLESTALAGIVGVLAGGAIALLTTLITVISEHFIKSRDTEQRFRESVSQQALELARMDYEMRMKGNQEIFLAPAKVYREFYWALTELQETNHWPKRIEDLGLLNIFAPGTPNDEQRPDETQPGAGTAENSSEPNQK